jgi:hypothetical protein
MERSHQRKTSKYNAETAFILDSDNAADFPANSPGRNTANALAAVVSEIQAHAAVQMSGAARQQIGIKENLFDDLRKILRKMNRAANALAEDFDGIEDLFRMPRRRSEQIWLATAQTFHDDSAPFESEFQEYDLPATFRADLLALITRINTARTAADTADIQKGGATGGIAALVRQAGKLSRKLGAIVKNKFDDNPQKLAAWKIASHLESEPDRKTEGGGNPPV